MNTTNSTIDPKIVSYQCSSLFFSWVENIADKMRTSSILLLQYEDDISGGQLFHSIVRPKKLTGPLERLRGEWVRRPHFDVGGVYHQ